mgnify:CR=1 FL=1
MFARRLRAFPSIKKNAKIFAFFAKFRFNLFREKLRNFREKENAKISRKNNAKILQKKNENYAKKTKISRKIQNFEKQMQNFRGNNCENLSKKTKF